MRVLIGVRKKRRFVCVQNGALFVSNMGLIGVLSVLLCRTWGLLCPNWGPPQGENLAFAQRTVSAGGSAQVR